MSDLLVMLVFLPMAAGPFGFWMGLRYPKARDTFVLVVTVLEGGGRDLGFARRVSRDMARRLREARLHIQRVRRPPWAFWNC